MAIADDTLQSKQTAHILDLICEGEIKGLVNGHQSIFVDGTPLQNAQGVDNFTGYSVEFRNGTRTQSYIPGFSESESMVSVNVQVTKTLPVVRTVTTEHVDELYITLSTPRLYEQNAENGAVTGSSIGYTIEVQPAGGAYEKVVIDYAKTSGYLATADKIDVVVPWVGSATVGTQTATYSVQSKLGSGDWVEFDRVTVTGVGTQKPLMEPVAPRGTTTHQFAMGGQAYTFRAVVVSGWGFTINTLTYFNYVKTTEGLISGKASSTFSKSHTIPLPGNGPWNVRVSKTSDDTTTLIQRDLYWYSTTEVIHAKLRHPNSVLAGITIDSSLFGNIPSRAYDCYGLLVKVPSNYDPVTRTYTGIWDGTFKATKEWSDNPAWCYYDLVTAKRYGLGEFVSESQVDKATLYVIAKYCDEMVPDGFGGMEPRFSCNLYLQTREDAFKILTDMVALFAGMLFWSSGGLSCSQDRPEDAIYPFTNANVVDGEFSYSGSSRNVRHTTALISYNDPNDKYARKVEYVEDEEGVKKYGVRQVEMAAIGCASRGQAHRLGKRILLTERYLTEVVTFKTGLEGAVCYPGAVIDIMDNKRAGKRMGGRVRSATLNQVTLDKEVTLVAGVSYTLTVVAATGKPQQVGVVNVPGLQQSLTTTVEFSDIPNTQSIWILASSDLQQQQFKVTGIKQVEKDYEVTALAYNASKYAAIEQGLAFEVPTTSVIPSASFIEPPSSVVIAEVPLQVGQATLDRAMTVSWAPTPSAEVLLNYVVEWRYAEGNWEHMSSTVTSVTIGPVIPAQVEVRVVAVSKIGAKSKPATASATLFGKVAPPTDVTNFSAQNQSGLVIMQWGRVFDMDVDGYEIRYAKRGVTNWTAGTQVSSVTWGTQMTSAAVPPGDWVFMIKSRDTAGNLSTNAAIADCLVTNPNKAVDNWSAQDCAEEGTFVNMVISAFDRALLPESQLATAALGGWDTFDQFIPSPYASYSYETPVITGPVLYTYRAYASVLSSWPAGYNGNDPDISMRSYSPDSVGYAAWTVGYVEATGFSFKAEMSTSTGLSAVKVFDPAIDLPSRKEHGAGVVVPVGGIFIEYEKEFAIAPAVVASCLGDIGVSAITTFPSTTGFFARVASATTDLGGTINWTASGY